MRLALDPRAARLLRRLPRSFPYAIAEIVLIALIAVQAARLIWVVIAPVGPFGEWKARPAAMLTADPALLARFDPFFRLAVQPGTAVVTSLQLKLFGVRVDQAMGRGSAIIAGPDGIQNSFGVGDEIVPGVTLKSVAFDNVTIDRGGTAEQLFLDQSVAAPVAGGGGATFATAPAPQPASGAAALTAAALRAGITIQPSPSVRGATPRFALAPQGDGEAFRALGLQPGDVLTSINGQSVANVDQAAQLLASPPPDGIATIAVERAGQIIALRASIAR